MSELQSRTDSGLAGEASPSTDESDKTQQAEELLNTLRQLNNQSAPKMEDLNVQKPQNGNVQTPEDVNMHSPTPTEWQTLREHLREKPSDVDSWLKLVDLAEESGSEERTNETYEALLEAFPNTSSVQIAYINHLMESSIPNRYQLVETLFKRFLKTSPFVDLWKFYLTYVRRINPAKDTIRKAYEFALNHIGHEKESTEIWSDYIQLLKQTECATTWDEGQKMDAIRKAYQRAVQIPMDNVKRLWEEYQDFENGLNKITAKKFISDLTAAHMQARTVLNNLQEHLTVLFPPPTTSKTTRPSIWLPRPPTFTAADKALVGRWRLYLKWEEGNPLEIEDKDKAQLNLRLQSVYRKAVVRMRFFSEIWFMASTYTMGLSNDQNLSEEKRKERKKEATSILKQGIEANPSSFVLNFAFAEVEEANKSFEEVHATFERFLETLRKELDALETRVNNSNSPASSQVQNPPASQSNEAYVPGLGSQNPFGVQPSEEKPTKSKELSDRRTEYGLAWISYMRFARRAENLKSARAVFGKARRDRWTPWEVFEAAALMEYHCTKATDVAMRIFEKGLETFSDEVEFALRYLGFLISINDDSNARALFERVVGTFPPERSRPIWERWARYEYQFGSLEAAQILEKRIAEAYPNEPAIKRFAERHKYLGTDAIAVRDLGFVIKSSGNAAGKTNGAGITRSETVQSLATSQSQPSSQPQSQNIKRPPSPDHRRRDESRGGDYPPPKRQRPGSPARLGERDRDRWDGPPRRRYGSPAWDRDRDRDGAPNRRVEKDRDDEKPVTLPPVLSWFIGTLPAPSSFDGPVFRTDDLMQVFRNAVIPSSTGIRARSPPPPPRGGGGSVGVGGGRPPPDYSPYQGPGGGRRSRY